jgi:sterol 3beta-glucosyltransferase
MPVTPTTSTQTNDERWSNTIKDLKDSPPKFDINPAVIATGGLDVLKRVAEVLAPPPDMLLYPKSMSEQALSYMPFVANFPWSRNIGWNVRLTARTFTMLTIGSRGDVQPYIALGVRLMQDGHKCVIVTHEEFKDWIESYGIEHRQAGGDPTALMKLSNDHKVSNKTKFNADMYRCSRLDSSRKRSAAIAPGSTSCSSTRGTHARMPTCSSSRPRPWRACTLPRRSRSPTSAYPQAFMVPAFDMGPSFNYSSYVLFDNIMWAASSGQINRWRKKTLHLGGTDQSVLSISKVPFLYNFSPAVVPKPLDWEDDITITGYWNLENSDMDWTPPDSLIVWMDKAKAEGKKIVYIGFGSIVVPDPAGVTRSIIDGVERCK